MSKLIYIRLMRPINCLMVGFTVIVGSAVIRADFLNFFWPNLIYGFITGFTLTAASMSINDYYDRDIDAINEPTRPIPSGLITSKEALVFGLTLTSIGFATAYLTSIYCFAIAILAWVFFITYTTFGKRSGLPGNFLVSICIILPLIYGNYAVSDKIELKILIFASMLFLSNTGREITKGIIDVKGDELQRVKTLAVRYGEKNAAIASVILYLFAVFLSPIPWFLNLVSIWYIPLVLITDLGLTASSYILIKDYSRENAKKVKNYLLLSFIFGLIAFIVGTVR